MDKPYKCLQSQGQGHAKIAYRCIKFNAYCLPRACAAYVFAFADPL